MVFVTSYVDLDLDGVACSIAYAELLNRKNIPSKAVYSGNFGLEVNFVKEYTNNFPIEKLEGEYEKNDKMVLVDVADPSRIDSRIDPVNVIEIFDHHLVVSVEKFVNAKKHIESVGSCATLITEEFRKNGLVPSKNSAIYLYSAIVSNTVNFKNSVTTQRDIETASWLKKIAGLDDNYTLQMFSAKSNITNDNLYDVLLLELAIKTIANKKIGIAQIEMVGVERMATDLKDSLLQTLNRFRNENELDYIFFTGIDIIQGYNIFYTIDDLSRQMFSKALDIPDLFPGYKTKSIIMRKQIWPKLENVLGGES